MKRKFQIGVLGSAGPEEYRFKKPDSLIYSTAEKIGGLLAKENCILFCGGKGGIMESAARGAKTAGGITVGVVKGSKRFVSNKFIDIEIVTNSETGSDVGSLILSCDGLIVLGGGAGTLQEISTAYRNKIPMIAFIGLKGYGDIFAGRYLDDRRLIKIEKAKTAEDAVSRLLKLI